MIKDLGYQMRFIGIKDQWACHIAEDIMKFLQIKHLMSKDEAIHDGENLDLALEESTEYITRD